MKKWLVILCLLFPWVGYAASFIEGQDYIVIPQSASPAAGQKPVVTEFFSYGCPWCYKIETPLLQWQKQQAGAVALIRVPVVFHKEWIYYAKAYYAAELLGLGDKLNPLLFQAIQKKQPDLDNDAALINFFVQHGVEKATCESAFEHSTQMTLKLKESDMLMAQYQIQSVPAVVVNGRYKTDLALAKTPERMLEIVDYLIKKNK